MKSTWPRFTEEVEAAGGTVPKFVRSAFDSYLTCGIPEEGGFLRLGCKQCGTERALPLSCKRRGLCPSCGARRMHDIADGLMQRVLPDVPIRQYVLSPPPELVGLLGARTEPLSALVRIFARAMFDGIVRRVDAGAPAHPGAVVVVQRLPPARNAIRCRFATAAARLRSYSFFRVPTYRALRLEWLRFERVDARRGFVGEADLGHFVSWLALGDWP